MASKFKAKLDRLHQSRIRATAEQRESRPTGVYEAESTAPGIDQPQQPASTPWTSAGFEGFPLRFTARYAADTPHGIYKLDDVLDQQTAIHPAGQVGLEFDPRSVAYFDIETNGLGDGALSFCLGVGQWEGDAFTVTQFALDRAEHERDTLSALRNALASCEAIVTFNGKSFDIPRVRSRCKAHGVEDPFASLHHLDLLPLARQLLAPRGSFGLQELERDILRVFRENDVPGAEAARRYQRYQVNSDCLQLVPLFEHNRLDILTLLSLSAHLYRSVEQAEEPPQTTDSVVDFDDQNAEASRVPPCAEQTASDAATELTRRLQHTYRLQQSSRGSRRPDRQTESAQTSDVSQEVQQGARVEELRIEAESLLRAEDPILARLRLHEILALAPRHAYALRELSRIYADQGEQELARVLLRRLHEVAPY